MIFNKEMKEIVKIAVESQSAITKGVAQYDFENDKVIGASFLSGETENPENNVIEIYALPQGEKGIIDMGCDDCPFKGGDKIECCIDALTEDYKLEDEIKEEVEIVVREILSDHLSDTISTLNDIRIAISDIITPHEYFNVRNDDWEMRVLDTYVNNAVEYGFDLSVTPEEWLAAEIIQLSDIRTWKNDKFFEELGINIEEHNFDAALRMLND